MRLGKYLFVLLSLVVLAFGAAACGDENGSGGATTGESTAQAQDNVVKVELGDKGKEYFITVDKATVPAGTTTFQIDNVGTIHHEMAIFKTDLPADKLPLTDEGKVDEEKAGVLAEAVYAKPLRGDEDHRIRDGRGVDFTIDLQPGKYVLLCNLAGHYQAGQFVAFTVT
jgi:uncharacterized cupredoxin-like copper-binding protein